MAITFNGTNISAISFNGTAIGSVKFNGTEVFDEWVKCQFPSGSAICSSSNTRGFTFSETEGYKTLDNSSSTILTLNPNATKISYKDSTGKDTTANGAIFYIRIPTAWDSIKIASITIGQASGAATMTMCGSSSKTATSNALHTDTGDSGFKAEFVAKHPITDANATHTINSSVEIRSLKIAITRSSASPIYAGNYSFTFWILRSKKVAWENKYSVTLPIVS